MDPTETIVLPVAAAAPQRGSLPLLAAIVPVVSGVVLFAMTGSPLSLCFAALGPVMILGSFLDGIRQRRRTARTARAEAARAWAQVEDTVAEHESAERSRRRRALPNIAVCLSDPPLRRSIIAADVEISAGLGDGASPLRFTGTGERADGYRAQHRAMPAVPMAARLAEGVCVRGPWPIAASVARAIVLQLCLRHANAAIHLDGDGIEPLGLGALPQARPGRPGAETVHVGVGRIASTGLRLCIVGPEAVPPAGYHAVLEVVEPVSARLRTGDGVGDCAVEGISQEQAEILVQRLAEDQDAQREIPRAVGLREVLSGDLDGAEADPGQERDDTGESLRVAIGRGAEAPVAVDLVVDGPHALVTGVTGAGKSELLVSWVAALAATHSAERVSFVLADFKGGTAFERLRVLPHVAAVITDLDGAGAERGVQSLRAELRRREGLLAGLGARSIGETQGRLGRLVIVVDEFAALLQEHPDLAAVFTDIAARGRALGMHLILGTQRATGVIRDALATNCPLRVALRVTDPADSKAMIGTDAASTLPGDAGGRGLAYLRRPRDAAPVAFRVARTDEGDLGTVVARRQGEIRARSPWQPSLPVRVRRSDLAKPEQGRILIGLADEPEQQRQASRTLHVGVDRGLTVFGGPGSGKSTALAAMTEQVTGAVLLTRDPEQAWSVIDDLAEGRHPLPPMLAVDDVDRHLAGFPLEYAAAWAERLQRVIRLAGERGATVLLSASRCTGQISVLADLLPERALLRAASRTEHLTAGGEASAYDPERPAGRARVGGIEVQLAVPEGIARDAGSALRDSGAVASCAIPSGTTPLWEPRSSLVGVVSTAPGRTAEELRARFGAAAVQVLVEGAPTLLPQAARAGGGRVADDLAVLVGDADSWQRQYALWQRVQREGEVVVLTEAMRDLRLLVGVRELPPYAVPYAGRAWSIDRDGRPSRVLLPAPRGVSPAAPPAA